MPACVDAHRADSVMQCQGSSRGERNVTMTQGSGDRRERKEIGGGATGAIYFVVAVFSIVWIGAVIAYVRGYFGIGAEAGLNPANWGLAPHVVASLVILGILPPLFLWIAALSLHRAAALSRIATELTHATRRLSAPMAFAGEEADTAAAGFERRIQAMASALDGLDRTMKDIEDRLAEQISAVQAAGRQIGTEAQQIEKHLAAEREALRDVAHLLGNEANQVARMFGSDAQEAPDAAAAVPRRDSADAAALAEIGAALSGAREEEPGAAAGDRPARTGADGRPLSPLEELTAYLAHHRSTQDAAKALALMKKAAADNAPPRGPGEDAQEETAAPRYPLASDLLDVADERADAGGTEAEVLPDAPAETREAGSLHLGVPDGGDGQEDGREAADLDRGPEQAPVPEETFELDLADGEEEGLAEEDRHGLDGADAEDTVPEAHRAEPAPTREAAMAVTPAGQDEEEEEDWDGTGAPDEPLEELPSSLALELPKGLKTQLEGLHALTIDLNRLLGTNPPVANWRRYMNGERDVFTLHFIRWATDRREHLATAYGASEEFRKYADRYIAHHAKLSASLNEAEGLEAQGEALPATDVTVIAQLLAAARDAQPEDADAAEAEAEAEE